MNCVFGQGACCFENDGGHSTLVTEVQWQHAFAPGFVKCQTLLFDGYNCFERWSSFCLTTVLITACGWGCILLGAALNEAYSERSSAWNLFETTGGGAWEAHGLCARGVSNQDRCDWGRMHPLSRAINMYLNSQNTVSGLLGEHLHFSLCISQSRMVYSSCQAKKLQWGKLLAGLLWVWNWSL